MITRAQQQKNQTLRACLTLLESRNDTLVSFRQSDGRLRAPANQIEQSPINMVRNRCAASRTPLLLVAVGLLMATAAAQAQSVPVVVRCDSDSDCPAPQTCNAEAAIDAEDASDRGICQCPAGFLIQPNGECQTLEEGPIILNTTCVDDTVCGSNQVCRAAPAGTASAALGLCTCQCCDTCVFEEALGLCRQRECHEFCFASGGDTCLNGLCIRCWRDGQFSCPE